MSETGNYGRDFTADRQAQGFRSQDHLDAWYRYYDHTKACAECGPGKSVWLEGDASWQPTENRCATAKALDAAVDAS